MSAADGREDAHGEEVAATLPRTDAATLLLTETYPCIQGESTFAGLPFLLVRTARCNLRCAWCDSSFTFRGGERRSLHDVLDEVRESGLRHVLITGGEPLLQPAVLPFASTLCDEGFTVLVETGGSLDVGTLDARVRRIVDVKCPGSGEEHRNLWSNLPLLGRLDEVKFVIADGADYEYARRVVEEHGLVEQVGAVLFSPVSGDDGLRAELADRILADRLVVRLQLQLHKIVWPGDDRRR